MSQATDRLKELLLERQVLDKWEAFGDGPFGKFVLWYLKKKKELTRDSYRNIDLADPKHTVQVARNAAREELIDEWLFDIEFSKKRKKVLDDEIGMCNAEIKEETLLRQSESGIVSHNIKRSDSRQSVSQ